MANGSIKFFNATKGFGFITPEDGSKDVFVPAVSVTASGIPTLKPGQRVSFDTEPDSKGPKAVNLKLLADAPAPIPKPVRENLAPPADVGRPGMTLFYDPEFEESQIVLAALRAAGHDPRLVDYIATPPDRDALKNLSLLLRGGDQSLVRKYDPLFLELRLDDRFISDSEFWAAIVEHPSLINGPVLATALKARVCRSENAVKSFLGIDAPLESRTTAKPKGMPGNIRVAAASASAPVVKAEEVKKTEKRVTEKAPEKSSEKLPEEPLAKTPRKTPMRAPAFTPKPSKTEAKMKAKAKAKSETKAKATAKPKAKTKTVAKVTRAPEKPAPKPVKKVKRGAKK